MPATSHPHFKDLQHCKFAHYGAGKSQPPMCELAAAQSCRQQATHQLTLRVLTTWRQICSICCSAENTHARRMRCEGHTMEAHEQGERCSEELQGAHFECVFGHLRTRHLCYTCAYEEQAEQASGCMALGAALLGAMVGTAGGHCC